MGDSGRLGGERVRARATKPRAPWELLYRAALYIHPSLIFSIESVRVQSSVDRVMGAHKYEEAWRDNKTYSMLFCFDQISLCAPENQNRLLLCHPFPFLLCVIGKMIFPFVPFFDIFFPRITYQGFAQCQSHLIMD
jgi:hypothetical protein